MNGAKYTLGWKSKINSVQYGNYFKITDDDLKLKALSDCFNVLVENAFCSIGLICQEQGLEVKLETEATYPNSDRLRPPMITINGLPLAFKVILKDIQDGDPLDQKDSNNVQEKS